MVAAKMAVVVGADGGGGWWRRGCGVFVDVKNKEYIENDCVF